MKKPCQGAWAIIAILLLIMIVAIVVYATRETDGRLISSTDEPHFRDELMSTSLDEDLYGDGSLRTKK